MKLKDVSFLEENLWKPRHHIKKQRHYFANKGLSSQSYGFSSSHIQMSELDHKESWVPKNWCFWTVVLVKTLESALDCKQMKPVNPQKISPKYSLDALDSEYRSSNTLATWCKESTHLIRPWCSESLKAGGAEDDWGWDGWMASPTQWTWVWRSSNSWWWTGNPGKLQSMGSQRVTHDWMTELNWPNFLRVMISIGRVTTSTWLASGMFLGTLLFLLSHLAFITCTVLRYFGGGSTMPCQLAYEHHRSRALCT